MMSRLSVLLFLLLASSLLPGASADAWARGYQMQVALEFEGDPSGGLIGMDGGGGGASQVPPIVVPSVIPGGWALTLVFDLEIVTSPLPRNDPSDTVLRTIRGPYMVSANGDRQ